MRCMSGAPKLVEAVATFIPSDEQLLGVFLGSRGPRPGMEALAGLPFVLTLLLTSSQIAAWVVLVVGFVGVTVARTHVTVVRTDRSVLDIENGRRQLPAKDAFVSRLPASFEQVSVVASGDPRAIVGGQSMWVRGVHQDEAYRLSRLAPAT